MSLSALSRARIATSVLFWVHGVVIATWASRIPSIQSALGLSAGQLGLTLLGSAVGAIAAMPVSSRWLARFGSGPVTIGATGVFCLALPLLALAPTAGWLAVGLGLYGFSAGAMDVGMNAQAVTLEKAYGRSIMIGFHALFSAGGLAGSALGGWFAGEAVTPWQQYALVAAGMAVAAAVIAGWLLPGETDRTTPPKAGEPKTGGWGLAPLSLPLLGLCVVGFCSFLGEGAVIDWSGLYLIQGLGSSQAMAPWGYGVFSLAMAGGRLAGDALAERLGARRLAVMSCLMAGAGIGLAILAKTEAVALAGFMVSGLGFAAVVPLVFSGAGQLPSTTGNSAANLATVTLFSYGALLLGPTVVGMVSEAFGLKVAFGVLVGLCLVAAGFSALAFEGRRTPVVPS